MIYWIKHLNSQHIATFLRNLQFLFTLIRGNLAPPLKKNVTPKNGGASILIKNYLKI